MTKPWSDDGLTDITSGFQGLTQPIAELIDDLHRRGWTLQKVDIKDGQYRAVAKSPHKETLEATGRTEATAVGNVLVRVMRREHMRASSIRQKLGAWDHRPIEQQFSQIAQAYAGAPVYDPKAAPAWMELAQDCGRRAQIIRTQLVVEYVDDPVPYESADDLREDVTKKRHITITRAYAHHPVWSEQQMLDYRLVVDCLGHAISGGDWGWHGTCLAFAQLAPLFAEQPQQALYTELLGQSAFGSFYRQWGPQKICFLDELVEKEQEKQNKPGHHPVHPSQSIVPSAIPSIFSNNKMSGHIPGDWPEKGLAWESRWDALADDEPIWLFHSTDPEYADRLLAEGADPANKPMSLGRRRYENGEYAEFQPGAGLGRGLTVGIHPWDVSGYGRRLLAVQVPKGWVATSPEQESLGATRPAQAVRVNDAMINQPIPPDSFHEIATDGRVPTPEVFGQLRRAHLGAVGETPLDPNQGWQSGINPLPDAAYLWQRQDGVDPLNAPELMEHLRGLEPGITRMHPDMSKQAVINALRSSLLGSRHNAMGRAIHYQDLAHIPADVDDPMAYRDALEQRREAWNQAKGYAPGSHKQYWPEEQQFKQWVKATNPGLDDGLVQATAKRELLHMLTEEEERILAQDQGEQLPAEVIEHEAFEALRKRLKALTKPNVDQKVDFGDHHLYHEATHHADMYPPYLHSRMRPLAQISRHADELAEAARQDLLQHKGRGHHFRAQALNLGIPGLGPRQISNAWLHVAPQTSDLAIIEPQLDELLGHDYQTDMSNRDYFKHERELAAGRDAAGYSHLPLGAFSSGLWDLKAGGPGYHPDRSAFKAYAPTPHHAIDWQAQSPALPDWQEPYWWTSTQQARDEVAQDFDRNVATQYGRDEVPYQKTADAGADAFSAQIPLPTGPLGRFPWAIDPVTSQRLTGTPGTTLAQHLKDTFGHPSIQDVWNQDPAYEVGKAL